MLPSGGLVDNVAIVGVERPMVVHLLDDRLSDRAEVDHVTTGLDGNGSLRAALDGDAHVGSNGAVYSAWTSFGADLRALDVLDSADGLLLVAVWVDFRSEFLSDLGVSDLRLLGYDGT